MMLDCMNFFCSWLVGSVNVVYSLVVLLRDKRIRLFIECLRFYSFFTIRFYRYD